MDFLESMGIVTRTDSNLGVIGSISFILAQYFTKIVCVSAQENEIIQLMHCKQIIGRVINLKFATYLKFATCENTNKINELW